MICTSELITIIIPLYNAEKYIAQTLDSVFSQTHTEYEVIVVDDGSTDSSREICDRFAAEHHNMQLCVQENSGVGVARNRGLNVATGEFVLFLDSDDFLEKDALRSLLQCQRETDAEFVIGAYRNITETGELKQKRDYNFSVGIDYHTDYVLVKRQELLVFAVDFENYPATHYIMGFCWGRLYKTSLLRENNLQFNEKAWFADDSIFTLEYVSLVNKMAILKKTVLFYREYEQTVSISSQVTNGEPILRDAELFFDVAVRFMTQNKICDAEEAHNRIAWKVIGNIIIKMIKSTKDLNRKNRAAVLQEVRTIVTSSFTQELLKWYHPKPGNSWLIPYSMRFRFPRLVLWLCRKRAQKRYLVSKKIKM